MKPRDLPFAKSPRPRKKPTGPARDISANTSTKHHLIVSQRASYLTLDGTEAGTDPVTGGRPCQYPMALFSLIHNLHHATPSFVAITDFLRLRDTRAAVVAQIADLVDQLDPRDAVVARRWLKDPKIPSPSHAGRVLGSLERRGHDHEGAVIRAGVAAAARYGRFRTDAPVYSITSMIVGDGTVLSAASKGRFTETADPDTGVITIRRPDLPAMLHTEGGEARCTVYGVKVVIIWSVSPDRHGAIPLAFRIIDSTSPIAEADTAVELCHLVQEELKRRGHVASGLIYDRAAIGKHQLALNGMDMILTTRATADMPGQEGSHFRKPKYIGQFTAACGNTAHFASIQKRMHHQVMAMDGTLEHIPLTHSNYARRYGTSLQHYTRFEYDCTCGTDHATVFSWNGWNSARKPTKNFITIHDETAYQKALGALQPFAPKTAEFDAIYGYRNTAETKHSEIDMTLPFKRLQRWGLPSKRAAVAGYLHGAIQTFTALRDDQALRSLGLRE